MSLTRQGPGKVAFVGSDEQIYVADLATGRRRQLTLPKGVSALQRWGGRLGEERSAWPCWSPDARWIACFQARRPDREAAVVSAIQVDGVEERELAELDRFSPIYAQWSPDGQWLAVLSQGTDELELGVVPLDQRAGYRVLERGVPLFFTWGPDSARLLVHVGDRAQQVARLVVHDIRTFSTALLPQSPGAFCTPVYVGSRPVYVSDQLGANWVSALGPERGRAEALATFEGLVALVPDPRGGGVIVGAAERGEGSAYSGLWRVPLDGGAPLRLSELDCMAWFTASRGDRVLVASLDRTSACLRWRVIDEGAPIREVCPFWPSREQLFYLHFFEQFALSHSPVSADGRTLVYASSVGPDGDAASDEGAIGPRETHILALDLDDADAQPRSLGEGSFAVCSPC